MSQKYTISTQEYKLLDIIASKEENPKAPDVYMSLYPSTHDERLPRMTLAQVDQFQQARIQTTSSSAAGRYQFIRRTLSSLVSRFGLDRNLIFNNVMQDFLALKLLEGRRLRDWQKGTLTWNSRGANSNDPDAAFQAHLSQEWAAIPVPFNMQGHKRRVAKGESYYAGDGLNSAGMNADTLYRELRALRLQGPGETVTLDLATDSRSHPLGGVTDLGKAQVAASGGQTYHGGSSRVPRNTFTSAPIADRLPTSSDPYTWDIMDLMDNRYDFRTGKKVRDMIYNGTNSVAAGAFTNNNARPPVPDIGDSEDGLSGIIGYGDGQVDPRLAEAVRQAREKQVRDIQSRLSDRERGIQRGL